MSDRVAHYKEGLRLFGERRYAEAIASYQRALEVSPDWPDALHALATARSKSGDHAAAIETIEKVIALTPGDAFAFTSLSIFLMRAGKIPEAEKAAAQARLLNWKEELKKNPKAPPPEGGFKVPGPS
jgi:tetratricopeptide (TPR) repeat protein